MGNNLSANELLEEALYHIGEPYFNQLTQDIEILVDVINHEQTQKFIQERFEQNCEELMRQCREIETAKSLYDLFRGLKILIDGLSWTYSMAMEQGFELLFAGFGEDSAFLRNSGISLKERVKQFIDYLEQSIFSPKSSKVGRDVIINEFIEIRQHHMEQVYCISNEVGEAADMERARVIKELEAGREEIREEYHQNMAENNMERNRLADELKMLFEPIWRELVSPESVPEYSKKYQYEEGNSYKCEKVVDKATPSSLQWKQDWHFCSIDQISKKLIDYYHEDRSTESDDKMRHHVNECNQYDYLKIFIGRIEPWLVSIKSKITKLPQKSLFLRKKLIMKEVERLSKFYYARMLNKPELVRDHETILKELMYLAANEPKIKTNASDTWMSVMPLISFEQFSLNPNTNAQNISMMFVLNSSNTFMENHSIATELEKMFEVPLKFMYTNNGVKVFQLIKTIAGNVRKYVYQHIHGLSDLQIPAAFIGDYGLKLQRAMNPHYFRIYSIRAVDQADGFMSTYFSEFEDRGGEPYFCPNGWRRFSVDVGEMSDAMYENWPVAYHGTKKEFAQQILMSSIKSSGKCRNLPEGGGAVFLSPSIEYSGHPYYAGVWKTDKLFRKNKYIQLVLQVRVKKCRIFDKIEGTLPGARSFDPPFDPNFAHNREMEWIIKWPPGKLMNGQDGLLVYGVMLRVTDEHPCKLPQNKWWKKSRNRQWKEE